MVNGNLDLLELKVNPSDIIEVKGNWVFFWGQIPLNEKSEFDLSQLRKRDSLNATSGLWSSIDYPDEGYGTFYIKIILPQDGVCRYLRIPKLKSSVRVWLDGMEQKGLGDFSTEEQVNFVDTRSLYIDLKCYSEAHITMSISNYHYKDGGGIPEGVYLTSSKKMESYRELFSIVPSVLSILIILIALYHIFLFYSNKKRRLFFFALFMIFFCLRNFFIGEAPIYSVLVDIPYVLVQQLGYITLYFALLFYLLYLSDHLLERRLGVFINIMISIFVITAIFVSFAPSFSSRYVSIINPLLFLLISLYLIYAIVCLYLKKNMRSHKRVLFTIVMMLLYVSVEIPEIERNLNENFLLLFVNVCLLLLQLKISYTYWKMNLKKVIKLSTEVTELNQTIETGKEERTHLLSESIQQLQSKQQLVKRLVELKNSTNATSLNGIIAELKSTKLEESRKIILKQNIEELNFEFLKKLKSKHPDLTVTDIEICSLIKLGFSSREICNLRSTSKFALKSSRYRLRKKFELEPNDSLTEYLKNI